MSIAKFRGSNGKTKTPVDKRSKGTLMSVTQIFVHAPKGANRVKGMHMVESIFGQEPDLLADDEM